MPQLRFLSITIYINVKVPVLALVCHSYIYWQSPWWQSSPQWSQRKQLPPAYIGFSTSARLCPDSFGKVRMLKSLLLTIPQLSLVSIPAMYWRPCLPVPDLSAWSHAGLHVVRVTVMVLLYATAMFIGKQLPPASVRLSTSAHQCPGLVIWHSYFYCQSQQLLDNQSVAHSPRHFWANTRDT